MTMTTTFSQITEAAKNNGWTSRLYSNDRIVFERDAVLIEMNFDDYSDEYDFITADLFILTARRRWVHHDIFDDAAEVLEALAA